MGQPRVKGKFSSQYKERRGEPIALRLPETLDKKVRDVAGEQLKQWLEEAIALEVSTSGRSSDLMCLRENTGCEGLSWHIRTDQEASWIGLERMGATSDRARS